MAPLRALAEDKAPAPEQAAKSWRDAPAPIPQEQLAEIYVSDIVIVGVLGMVVAILVALLAPSAETSKTVRRVLIGAVVLMTFVSLAGAMAMAVTAWTVVPAGVMILGLVLLYRDIRGRGDGEA